MPANQKLDAAALAAIAQRTTSALYCSCLADFSAAATPRGCKPIPTNQRCSHESPESRVSEALPVWLLPADWDAC